MLVVGVVQWGYMNDTLDSIAERARPIFQKYGFRKVGLFGSRARGDYRSDSDVDFLVAFDAVHSLSHQEAARQELETLFGVSVDLVPDTRVIARMRPFIAKDLQIIYEK